jgi:hypothetical protein
MVNQCMFLVFDSSVVMLPHIPQDVEELNNKLLDPLFAVVLDVGVWLSMLIILIVNTQEVLPMPKNVACCL